MNAVIYARYSSYAQTEQSIEGQLRDCHAFAERCNYTVINEYIDRAISGRSDDRPAFQQMIQDAAKKQFQYIIVWKLDRFSRNRYDSAVHKAKLKKYGVRVISATENISEEPEGIMLEGMLESLAEYYSANLAKHVKRGMRESALKGNSTGGFTPIGYKIVNKKLVVDLEKADAVRYAFEQYAKGRPKKQIVEELNARGLRNSMGRPLTLSSLGHALRNPKYKGTYIYDGIEIPGGCEAIVDEETFNAVQERLKAAKRAPAASKAKVDYLLQGKGFCGYCGAPLVGESGRSASGTVHHYYACAAKKKTHTCKKKNEKKGYLEWYVVEQTVDYVLQPKNMENISDRIVEQYEKDCSNKKIRQLQSQNAKIDKEIKQAVDASLEAPPKIRPQYYEKIELLQIQKDGIEQELASLKLLQGTQYTKKQILSWLKIFCNGDPLDPSFQRHIIDTFINAVYLYDDHLAIYYNIKNSKQVSYIEMLESTEEILSENFNCSNLKCNGPPKPVKSEHGQFIFINGLFGCILKKN